ncbi:hypothetical protein C8A03DRAFT_16983 [Achaetomium macrosporum]|uniref:Uncharacterized protein n=1 Tax=Achaetomium macrosporum TaxID=79813 RepID=A0AAN7C6N6_9PEZI|nr:hypothetical protein C8A03DRAFT_16983 [Achaetomium macrosporum]
MAASVETSQYERDLRSARKEWKRSKDSAVKWSRGSRHLAGIRCNIQGDLIDGATAPDCRKFRPEKKFSESHHLPKHTPNLVKMRSLHHTPLSRKAAKLHALSEIQAADHGDASPGSTPSLARTLSASAAADAGVLYSFDRTDSPGAPLTLEVFVKKTTWRETEKLVEREYEVLDGNGESLRGRRATALLRKGGTTGEGGKESGGDEEQGVEDDGFELV